MSTRALSRQRPRDLHELLLGDREIADARVERELRAPHVAQRASRDLFDAAAVDRPEARRLPPQRHVLGHGHVRAQRELLAHDRHPAARASCGERGTEGGAVQHDLARVGRDRAGEDLHERALPRAVLPDDRVHLARLGLEVDLGERLGRAERARHAADRETRRLFVHHVSAHSPSHFFRSGWSNAAISGCARFALFTSLAPVSIRLLDRLAAEHLRHRLHRELADAEGVLHDERVDLARRRAPATSLLDASNPMSRIFPASPALRSASSMPKVVDSFGAKTPATPPEAAFCAASRLSLVANALSVVAPRVLVRAHDGRRPGAP